MTANTNAGDGETYGDIIGCISQYFFEGWKYRVSLYGKGGTEPYEKVRKEANEAARIAENNYWIDNINVLEAAGDTGAELYTDRTQYQARIAKLQEGDKE